MTPTIYVGDHQHAKVVCSAFAEGCNGKLVPAMSSRLREGPAAMWGILRGSGERIKECELYGHPYFYIDHGYFIRGHYDGYYRVVFCDRHLQGPPQPSDGKRWEALGLKIAPLCELPPPDKRRAVYLPVSRHVAAYMGFDPEAFDEAALLRLRQLASIHPDNIEVHAKGDADIKFDGSEFVVGFQSNALIEAALVGCEVVDLGVSPAKWCINVSFSAACFEWLADNQWTLEEMRSGKCWADLMARYGDHLTEAAA